MGTDPFNAWTIFLTQMIGLSVATERVTETIKQWLGPALTAHLSPARYAGIVQTIAIVSGMLMCAASGLNPINIPQARPFDWTNKADWLCWAITGILVSGGSAFWNHLLDILKAAKVQREQLANLDVPAVTAQPIAP